MKVDAKTLGKVARELKKVADTRKNGVFPVLSAVKITAQGHKITLEATDLDVSAKVIVDAEADRHDDFTVLAAAVNLADALKGLAGPVELSQSDGCLSIVGEQFAAIVPAPNAELADWPKVSCEFAIGDGPQIAGAWLSDIAAQVGTFISTDKQRPILGGILFGKDGQVVATDSYRLAWRDNGPAITDRQDGLLLDGKSVKTAAGVFKALKVEQLRATQSGRYVTFATFDPNAALVAVSVNIVEGTFPNYRQLIPDGTGMDRFTVDAKALADALSQVKASKSDAGDVALMIEPTDNAITLTVEANKQRRSRQLETNRATRPDANETPLACNSHYLWQIAKQCDGDTTVRFEGNRLKPYLIDNTANTTRHLIMPMRIKENN